MSPTHRKRDCPICGKTVDTARDSSQSFAPFCSRRCKDRDLNQWLSGGYSIPAHPDVDDSEGVPSIEPNDGRKTYSNYSN